MDPLVKVESGIKPLARIAAIGAVFAGLGVVYWFVMDNLYKPRVRVTNVDYDKGIADMEYKDLIGTIHKRKLYSGSKLSAGGHWCVQFAGEEDEDYSRVELVKNDITHKVLNLSPAVYGDSNSANN